MSGVYDSCGATVMPREPRPVKLGISEQVCVVLQATSHAKDNDFLTIPQKRKLL